ncbi:formate dehydrogenase accessory sulfurtransferase FdhD [Puniceicoccus vermicola]|uniref:Sulfur carrier protein FdhD n=1 Tax=Puniceicoccus vermicola TaxID=388746 RepID=A0A7X1AZ83_9BACT|nr:formate dehydrogenase accessory sulfurtransferase FdhD [Puniceicoccus vermicola]MBC2602686.1 formate dehydrogenase accessory sulfurtransferase FdhD [Puniceicoccus vermicola]
MIASKAQAQSAPAVRSTIKVIRQRIEGNLAHSPETDFLAIEDPLELSLCSQSGGSWVERNFSVTMRTPGNDEELIYGLLYAEGIIQRAEDIKEIDFTADNDHAAPNRARIRLREGLDASAKTKERHFAVHSSCGACGTVSLGHLEIPKSLRIEDPVEVDSEWIHSLPRQMREQQNTFEQTGGLHAAAIFSSDGQLEVVREDIGRHNALDKAIGTNLLNQRSPCTGQTLCVSGRMSYEIIQKALIARIPIIAGVGAPSSLAVALANDFNLTLIGFLRDHRYNLYSCPERIRTAP